MTQNEIKTELKAILGKIDGQVVGAWGSSLENTTEAVIIENMQVEDSQTLAYNNWLADLCNLMEKLK
jgi:hypothetical protein